MKSEDVDAGLCVVIECARMRKARGLCQLHYDRLRAHGTTDAVGATPKRYASVAEALADRSVPNGSCVQWSGPVNREGYGRLAHGNAGFQAHRAAYELAHGPLPAGVVLDHTCHTRAAAHGDCAGGPRCLHRSCVNPDHLEPVSQRENTMRSPLAAASVNAAKTECIHGHPFDAENTHTDKVGKRHCRACSRIRDRRRRAAARLTATTEEPTT